MKSDKFLLAAGAFLLVWSMRGEAHGSHEAVMEGGSLLQMTVGFLHPVLEAPYLLMGLLGIEVLVFFGIVNRYRDALFNVGSRTDNRGGSSRSYRLCDSDGHCCNDGKK